MTVRAKFTLQSITQFQGSYKELKFGAVYDTSTPENERFTKATPSGQITMSIDNPAALEQFEIGKSYYLDFTPAS